MRICVTHVFSKYIYSSIFKHTSHGNIKLNQVSPLTKHLGDFITANGTLDKADLVLSYVANLNPEISSSHLLAAELVYLFFFGPECPLNFNSADDY